MNRPKISFLIPVYNRKKLLYTSLQSLSYFYGGNQNIEYVIVDDGSDESEIFNEVMYDFPNLSIKHIRIDKKRGYNPSFAYNVAARRASGDIFLLTSAENFHTKNILDSCEHFNFFQKTDYYLFSVFCLTDREKIIFLTDSYKSMQEKLTYFQSFEIELYNNLGCNGYSYNNNLGSWYLHEKIKPSKLNFCTALHKELYYELSGFNEMFMQGTGFDDQDFLDRLSTKISNFFWFDSEVIHIDHEVANKSIQQNSNHDLYKTLNANQNYLQNNLWGLL